MEFTFQIFLRYQSHIVFGVTCARFLEYLVDKVQGVHSNDRTEPQEQIMPGTCNLENGIAYYFKTHSCQVCKHPDFAINPVSRTYDNDPVVDDKCCKKFPSVSYGGFWYMFLWFCPMYGHCYGLHLISCGEGRKDPFSSLLKYKSTAPDELLYDFACQLNEYCLHRAPHYFRCTHFWHDLFHGITHKCGECFKGT